MIGALSQELGRSPTIAELAAEAGVSEEEVLEALEAGQAYRFDVARRARRPGDDDDGETLGDAAGRRGRAAWPTPSTGAAARRSSPSCPQREQTILYLRFFEGLTQSEIAARLGISQMHVSRLLARSLEPAARGRRRRLRPA